MKRFPFVVFMSGAVCAVPHAQAFEFFNDMLRLEGFGTLGVFSSNLDPADVPASVPGNSGPAVAPQVRADIRQGHGATKGQVIWDADTALALQATINPTGNVKGVIQLLSKQDINGSEKPRVEWLYGSWQASPELNIKVGRVVAPIFMMSDSRNIAYAQTMVRPPTAVYQINPFTNLDGATFVWETRWSGGYYSVEGLYGRAQLSVASTAVDVPQSIGLATRLTMGDWTWRIGASHHTIDIGLTPNRVAQLDAARQLCSNCNQIVNDRLGLQGQHASIFTAGLQWEHNGWQVAAEWARRPGSTVVVPDLEAGYVLGAVRIGNWTPYISWGRFRNTESPLGFQGPAPGASALLADLDDARFFGRSSRVDNAAGVRWDFMPRMALKAQWEQARIDAPRNGSGSLIQYATPNTRFGGTVDTYTVNLDFVF